VGSGLILLVIVGAWLAVLVPMALRSHDASNSLGGVDKFHDAMRVLSRRTGAAAGGAEDEAGAAEPAPAAAPRVAPRSLAARRAAAARRRRLLLALIALSALTLVGALMGPAWALAPHLVVDLLLVAFVVQLRRTALRRAERDLQAAMRERPAARPAAAPAAARTASAASCAVRQAVHVVGIPSRMPPRPAPLDTPMHSDPAAPAASYEAPPAARGAQGEAWSPVPVPAPTYLSAPAAPRRSVDLTRASANADGLADAERELGIVDEGPQLDEILDRRRAVNDW
jgi:hypothetical protein